MKRALHLFALILCQQMSSAQDSGVQLAQQLINHVQSSELSSWKHLADFLSAAFDENSSGSDSSATEDQYSSARRKALQWLSTDEYAIALSNDANNNNNESDKKQLQLLQRYALATIYYSTSQNGKWNTCDPDTSTPCESDNHRFLSSSNHLSWEGINGKNGLATWLDLNTRNLSNHCPSSRDSHTQTTVHYDALPPEMALLSPSLELLWLHSNPLLCGRIPSYIGEFSNLQTLSLYSTKMSGSIPNSLYNIEKLTSIRLYRCNFSGLISDDMKKLRNLKWLWIHENEFTGVLPDLGELTLLEGITLHGNGFAKLESNSSGLCPLLKGSLKYLWVDCQDGSLVKEGDEWAVVEGKPSCECCTRCFPRDGTVDNSAVAVDS